MPTSTSGAVLGFSVLPKDTPHADQGIRTSNPLITNPHSNQAAFFSSQLHLFLHSWWACIHTFTWVTISAKCTSAPLACQSRVRVKPRAKRLPKHIQRLSEIKAAVPLTFWEMPCMTTSKSYSKSLLSPFFRVLKSLFPFKGGGESDKPESGLDILASRTSEPRAPLLPPC